jgi:hypothetical protein
MKTFQKEDIAYTPSEWFVGKITIVGDKTDVTGNFPCSWTQFNFYDDLQTINEDNAGLLYGLHELNYNTAYPISQQRPSVGDICLFRQRGTANETEVVYEFINSGGFDRKEALTAIQCSGQILSATYSSGCRRQK